MEGLDGGAGWRGWMEGLEVSAWTWNFAKSGVKLSPHAPKNVKVRVFLGQGGW
jgi:glycyl-tRNA synthetase alpha subunit